VAKTVPEKIAKIVPKLVPNTRKKPTKKMPRLEQFHRLHGNLVQELTLFEAQTAAQKSDLTEHDERHLRILAMLIKSLDGLMRFETNFANNDGDKDMKQKLETIEEIERRLARLAKLGRSADVS